MKSKFKKDVDYEFVGITESPKWAIRMLTGDYKEVIIRYDDIKVETLDESEDENSDFTLSFGYTILNETALSEDYNENHLGQMLGDVLASAIQDGLEDGTAVLNER